MLWMKSKILEEDARSIKNTLQNIKDPDNLKDSISNDSEKVKAIK